MTTDARWALDRSMVRAVAWNAGAKWISQIFAWIATIIVARLLQPYDYGLVGMAGIYLNLTSLVSQVGVPDAIITLRDLTRRQIAELNAASVAIGSALFGISCGMAFPISRFFSAPPLRSVVIAVSTTYMINAFQVVPRALLQKELRFKMLAAIETARAVAQMITTLILAWLGFGYWSLVYGMILGGAVATVLTLYWRRHRFAVPHLADIYRELRFSGQVTVSGIAYYVYSNADFLVAGRMLGEAPLGDYTVAWTISSAPIEKIGNLLTSVTPAYFSAVQHSKFELRRYFLRLTEALAYVTVPASIGIALVSDYLVPVLLGPKWSGVVSPLRILGISVAFRSLTTMLPRLLTALRDTKVVMWVTLIAATLMPVSFLIGSRWGTKGIAMAWIIVYPPMMSPLFYRTFRNVESSAREYLGALAPAVGATVFMAAAVLLMRSMLPGYWPLSVRFVLLIVTGTLCYAVALVVFYRERINQLIRGIGRRSTI